MEFDPIIDALGVAVFVHDAVTGEVLYVSKQCEGLYGYTQREIIERGLRIVHVNDEDYNDDAALHYIHKAASGESQVFEWKSKKATNEEFWVEVTLNSCEVSGRKCVAATVKDITESKNIQFKIKENEKLLSSISKNISDGIYRSIPGHKFVYVNKAFANLFGFSSKEEALNAKPDTLYANPEERQKVTALLTTEGQVKNKVFQFRRQDGSIFYGAMSSILTKDVNGNDVYDGAIRDITEQREIQIQVEENEKIISSINRNISEGIYRSYSKGGLIYVNDAFAKMFGYDSAEEIMSHESLDLYANPKDRKGETPEVMDTGYRSNIETQFKRKDGSTFWGLNSFVVTTDHEGNNVFDGAVRDISAEKEAASKLQKLNDELLERNKKLAWKEQELESSNEELRSNGESLVETLNQLSERNFELDQLVYKTSHDLRAPLRSVLGLTNLMKVQGITFDDGYIEKIEERVLKMDDFIKDMLSYSKASRMLVKFETVDLDELISGCLKDLEFLDNFSGLQVNVNFENGIKTVETDELRNRIIFGNIISNAFKYCNHKIDNRFLNINISVRKGSYKAVFEDNGIGISKEYLGKVFDMFFRATEESDGSGLGMYIVKQAIDKLHGTIGIESELGVGTTITVEIPC